MTTSSAFFSVSCSEVTSCCFSDRSTDRLRCHRPEGCTACEPAGLVATWASGTSPVDPVLPVPEVQAATAFRKSEGRETVALLSMQASIKTLSGRLQSRTGRWRFLSAPPSPPPRRVADLCARAGSAADDGRNVQLHAGAHRRTQGHLLDVGPLGAARFRLAHGADEGFHVADDRFPAEARLADAGMDQARLFRAELDLA